ncbi:olfactory receptor 5AP2-like [Hyperolius riggenbachi]|uniref:olfactory receptor 5AP2-like n=1 Tax=Hyperolius riggenbachi TaxID=752182 RepID=UPI0035A3B593
MEVVNYTSPARIILLGISDVPHLQAICFLVFLVMYLTMLSGNLLLVILVRITPKLNTPMYFFLSNLSIIDISFSSSIVPVILVNALAKDRTISILQCGVQVFFSLALGAIECMILAVMAYDRYVAICQPLHYNTIMSKRFCYLLSFITWGIGFLNSCILVGHAFHQPFCTPHLNHYFCEIPPILRIVCSVTWLNSLVVFISAGLIVMSSFCLTLVSYVCIISTVLRIRSSEGRHKAFSTCGSHLTVVSLYYGTILFMYLRPRSISTQEADRIVAVVYTAVTPMLNPFIYSMRNKDVKGSIICNRRKR